MQSRVLLQVEDDDAAFFLLQIALKEAGIAVQLHRVSDGEAAVAFLSGYGEYRSAPRPDLVFLDLNLPKVGGFEVLKTLKSRESLRSIPVVVFSTSSHPKDQRDSLALGAQRYVVKPSGFDEFVQAVQSACSYLPS